MTQAWFSADMSVYFSAVGFVGLTALAAPLIIKGRKGGAIITLWCAIIAAGIGALAAGSVAWLTGQPDHVSVPLLVTGLGLSAAYSFSLLFVLKAYRQAEARKVAAREL